MLVVRPPAAGQWDPSCDYVELPTSREENQPAGWNQPDGREGTADEPSDPRSANTYPQEPRLSLSAWPVQFHVGAEGRPPGIFNSLE